MSFAKKDIDEEGFGGPEEEVFLLMSTENFYIVPLDLNEHRALTYSYLELEKAL